MEASLATLDLRDTVSAPFMPERSVIVDIGGEVPELDLFALLLWHLARPNGMFTCLGPLNGDPDGPFKWDFSFRCPDGGVVSFVRSWRTLDARAQGRALDRADVIAFAKHNLALHADAVATTRARLERHTLVLNPYVRHRLMADHAERMLKEIDVPGIWYPDGATVTKAEADRHVESVQAHIAHASRETFYSVSLVTESAYAAEAFLNLILAFTLLPMIRENRTLFEETMRRNWKAKIQYLPLTSSVVPYPPDMGDARIRDAGRLFDLRNRIAHSYPDPDDLAVGHVHFFENFPILEHGGPFDGFQLATQRRMPSRAEAIAGKHAAMHIVQFLSELIADPVRDQVLLACDSSPLGWRADTKSFSVPFGRPWVRAFAIRSEEAGNTSDV
ncbi:MAG: hypothetical protein K8H88_11125 [Sandaracinaceae bacterium]|nr:hypothetical protein [Sandaracinaceae bacterium]